MIKNESRVSIIIPTYNRLELLKVAIDSCLRQTHRSIEVLVVDDGSTDGTVDYLRSVSFPSDQTFHWAEQANQGPSVARNRGLEMSSGAFIKYLDSDDALDDKAIENYVRSIERFDVDCCIGAKRSMSPEGRVWQTKTYVPPEVRIDDPLHAFFDLKIRPQQGQWCFRRSVFGSGVRWNEELRAREDTDILARILLAGARVCGSPDAIYHQRYHDGPRVSAGQFLPGVSEAIYQSNLELYRQIVERDELERYGRRFARALSRTALRLWETNQNEAIRYYKLAQKCYGRPELVLLADYSPMTRFAAYALWSCAGLRVCGELFKFRNRIKQSR